MFSETSFLTKKQLSKTLILHHPLKTVHKKYPKTPIFIGSKKGGQVIDPTVAKLLTLKWPKCGQVIDPGCACFSAWFLGLPFCLVFFCFCWGRFLLCVACVCVCEIRAGKGPLSTPAPLLLVLGFFSCFVFVVPSSSIPLPLYLWWFSRRQRLDPYHTLTLRIPNPILISFSWQYSKWRFVPFK